MAYPLPSSIREINQTTFSTGEKSLRVVFGPHHFLELEKLPDGKAAFHLRAIHHDFEADASEPGGPRDPMIELVRQSRPESTID